MTMQPPPKRDRRSSTIGPRSVVKAAWESELKDDYTRNPFPNKLLSSSTTIDKFRLACAIGECLELAIDKDPNPFEKSYRDRIKDILSTDATLNRIKGSTSLFCGLIQAGAWYSAIGKLIPDPDVGQLTAQKAVAGLRLHWKDTYLGRSALALRQKICNGERSWDAQREYSKSFDIIQSSGTGKSRLVHELGTEDVMLLSLVFRRPFETGFPPGDPEVYEYIMAGDKESPRNVHLRAIGIVGAIGQVMYKFYSEESKNFDNFHHCTVVRAWNNAMGPIDVDINEPFFDPRSEQRQTICNEIVATARKFHTDNIDMDWDWDNDTLYEKSPVLREYLIKPLQRLFQTMKDHGMEQEKTPVPIIFAFDEAANLYAHSDDRHTALRRALRSCSQLPLWSIFLSTNSRIQKFVPGKEKDTSGRVVLGELQRIEPFLSLEQDVAARKRAQSEAELARPVSQFASVDHMTTFGRPLWQLFSDRSYSDLRTFALYKLLGGLDPPVLRTGDRDQVFAVLASRISLDPALNKDEVASESVNSHLRLITAIDSSAGMIRTVTPSEPLVADAAAHLLMETDVYGSSNWVGCVNTFTEHLLSRGLVDKGMKGELYARLMCILARDFLLRSSPTFRQTDFPYSQPFALTRFLETLTGRSVFPILKDMLSSKPATRMKQSNIDTSTVERMFNNAYINFNHFSHTDVPLLSSTFNVLLLRLLRTNCALQLSFGQPNWDLLIPIYFGPLDQPYESQYAAALFVQVKFKMRKTPMALGGEYKGFHTAKQDSAKFFFYLQLELGVVTQIQDPVDATIRWPEFSNKGIPQEPWVFGMRVAGNDSTTFPFLKNDTLELACSRLLKEILSTSTQVERDICADMVRFNSHTYRMWEEPGDDAAVGMEDSGMEDAQ